MLGAGTQGAQSETFLLLYFGSIIKRQGNTKERLVVLASLVYAPVYNKGGSVRRYDLTRLVDVKK